MEKKEVRKVVSFLLAAYPKMDLGDKPEATLRIWDQVLMSFPLHIAEEAAKEYIFEGHSFFPNISEFIKTCDNVWQRHERMKREENEQAERDAAHLLFSEPLDKIDRSMGRIAKLSVALVRDVCNDEIKYKSPEWNKRQSEIERLAGV